MFRRTEIVFIWIRRNRISVRVRVSVRVNVGGIPTSDVDLVFDDENHYHEYRPNKDR